MPWIDPQGLQHISLPRRVRLDDKTTRTSDAVTEELLIESGWRWEDPPPVIEEPYVEEFVLNATPNFTVAGNLSIPLSDSNISISL